MTLIDISPLVAEGLSQLVPDSSSPGADLKKLAPAEFDPLADKIVRTAHAAGVYEIPEIDGAVRAALADAPMRIAWRVRKRLLSAITRCSFEQIRATLKSGLSEGVETSRSVTWAPVDGLQDPGEIDDRLRKAEAIFGLAFAFNEAQRQTEGPLRLCLRAETVPGASRLDEATAFKTIRDGNYTVRVSLSWEDDAGENAPVSGVPCVDATDVTDLSLWWNNHRIFQRVANPGELTDAVATSRAHYIDRNQRLSMVEPIIHAACHGDVSAQAVVIAGLRDAEIEIWECADRSDPRRGQRLTSPEAVASAMSRAWILIGKSESATDKWQRVADAWREALGL